MGTSHSYYDDPIVPLKPVKRPLHPRVKLAIGSFSFVIPFVLAAIFAYLLSATHPEALYFFMAAIGCALIYLCLGIWYLSRVPPPPSSEPTLRPPPPPNVPTWY